MKTGRHIGEAKEIRAQVALRTYYVYIQAFTIKAGNLEEIIARQNVQPAFQNLQVTRSVNLNQVRQTLHRGWLTLKAMDALPIDENPDLAITANFWAPVQAYYAAHGIGMAALSSLGVEPPEKHRAFRSAVTAQIVTRLLPHPFNMTCCGNPADRKTNAVIFNNCTADVATVKRASNLENPIYADAEILAAKALMTTRNRMLEDIFDEVRKKKPKKGKERRNLNGVEKSLIESKLHPTSIYDFLYRMRVRSNYDDPEMYIYGQGDADTAKKHYDNLLQLAKCLTKSLEQIILKKIGTTAFEALKSEFQ